MIARPCHRRSGILVEHPRGHPGTGELPVYANGARMVVTHHDHARAAVDIQERPDESL